MIRNLKEIMGDLQYVIIAEFEDIDYTLIYRGTNFQPWIAAWQYRGGVWGQGHYFETIEEAMNLIRKVRIEKEEENF